MPVRQNHRQYDQYHCRNTQEGSEVVPGQKMTVVNKKQIAGNHNYTKTDDDEPEFCHTTLIISS